MSILRKTMDTLHLMFWSMRGQKWQALYTMTYRDARRRGCTHEEACELAEAFTIRERLRQEEGLAPGEVAEWTKAFMKEKKRSYPDLIQKIREQCAHGRETL